MPKLYFYDTGIACALLGIQGVSQLKLHYLRGSLFENFVINEMIKFKFNRGLSHNLFFWRDSTGHEIDVVTENSNGLYPVEIKAGQTVNSEFFTGLEFWAKISGIKEGTVVYAGDTLQSRSSGVQVIPWKDLYKHLLK